MTAKRWKSVIKKACVAAGTYRPHFDSPIDALSKILEQRDATYQAFIDGGALPVLEHTNSAGATNVSKNPLIMLWNDLNVTALSYWRDLGLTPAGLKKINETAMKPQKKSALSDALRGL